MVFLKLYKKDSEEERYKIGGEDIVPSIGSYICKNDDGDVVKTTYTHAYEEFGTSKVPTITTTLDPDDENKYTNKPYVIAQYSSGETVDIIGNTDNVSYVRRKGDYTVEGIKKEEPYKTVDITDDDNTFEIGLSTTSLPNNLFKANKYLESIKLNNVKTVTQGCFSACTNLVSVDFGNCEKIEGDVLDGTSVDVLIAKNCTEIKPTTQSKAFAETTLKKIVLPSITSGIGESCFFKCTELTDVVLPNCTLVPSSGFYGCTNLTNVYFPLCETISGCGFYSGTSIENAYFPNCVTIRQSSFQYCSGLTNVTIPKCETIGQQAFYKCGNIVNLDIKNVKTIDSSAFLGCSGITGEFDLKYCETIEQNAFYYCSGITSISLPNCKKINNYAFASCENLKLFDFSDFSETTPPNLTNANAFSKVYRDYVIVVPDNLYDTWIEYSNWVSISTHIKPKSLYENNE